MYLKFEGDHIISQKVKGSVLFASGEQNSLTITFCTDLPLPLGFAPCKSVSASISLTSFSSCPFCLPTKKYN